MSEKQGELFPEDKPKRKPRTKKRAEYARNKRNRKQSAKGQAREEAKRGGEQLSPEELFGPNYKGKPTYTDDKYQYRNLLRILQAVPAKAAQATRIGLSIAGIGGGMYR